MNRAMRRCLREPISQIFGAAELLDDAAAAHLHGETEGARRLIQEADNPLIASWTESIWGKRHPSIHTFSAQADALPHLGNTERPVPRMPDAKVRSEILARDGYHCRFCGIPVIPSGVRQFLCRHYPDVARWGRRNADQHAALQCMWLQFDHLVPNERGGMSALENVIVTCAPCNFGRMQFTIEEAGLENPLARPIASSWSRFDGWDGLTRLLN